MAKAKKKNKPREHESKPTIVQLSGRMTMGGMVARTAPLVLEDALPAAIRKHVVNGHRPGRSGTVRWGKFCDLIRKDCNAYFGKDRRIKLGYSDISIKRCYSNLKKLGL